MCWIRLWKIIFSLKQLHFFAFCVNDQFITYVYFSCIVILFLQVEFPDGLNVDIDWLVNERFLLGRPSSNDAAFVTTGVSEFYRRHPCRKCLLAAFRLRFPRVPLGNMAFPPRWLWNVRGIRVGNSEIWVGKQPTNGSYWHVQGESNRMICR